MSEQITYFGLANFRNRQTPFGIKQDDRRRHMYVIGKTGMGKTTLLEQMVIQDIYNGHGVCFVDPHGDSVEKILDHIPSHRINDVIYFNPADIDYPIAFNVLEKVEPRYKHLVASGMVGVFKKIWADSWGPRLEYILRNTILALLDYPSATLLGILRMLSDTKFRKKVVEKIEDPVVKKFWTDEFARYDDKFRNEAIAPIQNKVGQFVSSSLIRNIIGQTKSSINMREVMDGQKILLLNLAKGRIGEDNAALLGAMMITKIQLAAMSRVDIPEETRKDFYLYVDEFQNFATQSFANILSEARKYRLNLLLAHQFITQIEEEIRDAVFGNVGTLVCFRVGAADAEFLEPEFAPVFTQSDLVNLGKFSIYLKLMINGIASDPFSAGTLPPNAPKTGNMDKIIKVSRERYGSPVSEVHDKITSWLAPDDGAETEGPARGDDRRGNFDRPGGNARSGQAQRFGQGGGGGGSRQRSGGGGQDRRDGNRFQSGGQRSGGGNRAQDRLPSGGNRSQSSGGNRPQTGGGNRNQQLQKPAPRELAKPQPQAVVKEEDKKVAKRVEDEMAKLGWNVE